MIKSLLLLGFLLAAFGLITEARAKTAAIAPKCFLSAERPLADHAAWSATCAGVDGISGYAINRLDQLPECGHANACFEPVGVALQLDPKILNGFPLEGSVQPPACASPDHPEWVRIGFVQFHRSCFRSLSEADHQRLQAWAGVQINPAGLRKSSVDTECRLDKFGELALDAKSGGLVHNPAHKPWVRDFLSENPPKSTGGHLGTAAESIYTGFHDVMTANDQCLEGLNPDLAERVRQAMGVHARPNTNAFFRPAIECQEQVAFECDTTEAKCSLAKRDLSSAYREGGGGFQNTLSGITRGLKCHPAHSPGAVLGSIDATGIASGKVVAGAPRIQLFNPTGLFHKGDTGGRSTLLHELLHAAGATDSIDHNEGAAENEIPAGDQVYACQAVVYEAFFKDLRADQLREACLTCADVAHKFECTHGEKGLQKLGCRRR